MNTTTIDLAQAQPTLADLLKLTAKGTEVTLLNAGQPVARLTPSALSTPDLPPTPRVPGLSPGAIWISDDFDEPLPDAFWLGEDG